MKKPTKRTRAELATAIDYERPAKDELFKPEDFVPFKCHCCVCRRDYNLTEDLKAGAMDQNRDLFICEQCHNGIVKFYGPWMREAQTFVNEFLKSEVRK